MLEASILLATKRTLAELFPTNEVLPELGIMSPTNLPLIKILSADAFPKVVFPLNTDAAATVIFSEKLIELAKSTSPVTLLEVITNETVEFAIVNEEASNCELEDDVVALNTVVFEIVFELVLPNLKSPVDSDEFIDEFDIVIDVELTTALEVLLPVNKRKELMLVASSPPDTSIVVALIVAFAPQLI